MPDCVGYDLIHATNTFVLALAYATLGNPNGIGKRIAKAAGDFRFNAIVK